MKILLFLSVKILTHFLPLNTDSLSRQSVWSLYLTLGSIKTLFLILHQNSSGGRGLLSSLGVKESGAPYLWSLLQHQSTKSVLPAFRSWHRKLCSIQVIYGSSVLDIPLSVVILAGSYNGMYFQGSHFMTRKVGSFFPDWWWHHEYFGSDFGFLSFGFHTGKNQ